MTNKQIKDLTTKLTSSNTDMFALDTAAGITYKIDKQTLFEGTEQTSNKVTSFQATPDDTHYPSEKLVKDSLDSKTTEINEARKLNYNGVYTLPTLTDNGNGTITLGNDAILQFYPDANGTLNLIKFSNITGTTLSLTNNTANYVYADYNSGSPIYLVTTDATSFFTDFRIVPLYRIVRENNALYTLDYDQYALALPYKHYFKDVVLSSFERQSGLILSTSATRISSVSLGVAWFGISRFNLDTNTAGSAGSLYQYYLVTGVWNKSLVTSYDSTYYSDGTNRQNLGVAKYVAKYFFRSISTSNEVYYIHGNQYNSASDALAEAVPTVPTAITSHSLYVGKIVIVQGATNGTAYPRAWDTAIQSAVTTNHNDLSNIQLATSGVTYGHINDTTQSIAGDKTFTGNIYPAKIGINSATATYQYTQKTTTALESATLGSELLTSSGWTTTNWTGTFATGFTHTAGYTDSLTNTLSATSDLYYQISFTVTGRTAGTFTITFDGQTSGAFYQTGSWGLKATSTGTFAINPSSTFNGTIILSIKQITDSYSPCMAILDNAGTSAFEIRNNLSSLNNVYIGKGAGKYNTTGYNNLGQGTNTLQSNITGNNNSAQGASALQANTSGANNSAQGSYALFNSTVGSNNCAQGTSAGRYIADGSTVNTNPNNSIFIGYNCKANADNETNQIVIGYNTVGNGSNTTTIGSSATTATYLRGTLNLVSGSTVRSLTLTGDTSLSGTNTGDETTSTIKTKLGQADTDSDGYLGYTDWNTFNGKDKSTLIFSGYMGTAQDIANTTVTIARINTSEVDTYSKFNSSTYTYTIPSTGVYNIFASLAYDLSANGSRYAFLYKNGSSTRYRSIVGASSTSSVIIPTISVELSLSINDTIQLAAYQNSGGSVALATGSTGNCTFIEIYKR